MSEDTAGKRRGRPPKDLKLTGAERTRRSRLKKAAAAAAEISANPLHEIPLLKARLEQAEAVTLELRGTIEQLNRRLARAQADAAQTIAQLVNLVREWEDWESDGADPGSRPERLD